MRALWNSLERLDRAAFLLSERFEQSRGRSFRERVERSVEEIRPPQKAIRFDE